MTDAISIIYYIFNKFIVTLFDTFTIAPNVSIGWIIVVIVIMAIMLDNVLSVARSYGSPKQPSETYGVRIDKYGETYYHTTRGK